ncbi:hypothetical protein [Cohnella rhizosphaerae]
METLNKRDSSVVETVSFLQQNHDDRDQPLDFIHLFSPARLE